MNASTEPEPSLSMERKDQGMASSVCPETRDEVSCSKTEAAKTKIRDLRMDPLCDVMWQVIFVRNAWILHRMHEISSHKSNQLFSVSMKRHIPIQITRIRRSNTPFQAVALPEDIPIKSL